MAEIKNSATLRLELITVVACVFLATYALSDFDTFWHLSNGRAMVQGGKIVETELFSYSADGTPFDNHAWLAQIIMYLAWALGGATGLIVFKLAIVAGVVWMTMRTFAKYGLSPIVAAIGSLWMTVASLYLFTERPNLFSLLFLALLLLWLETNRAAEPRVRTAWLMAPLFVVWDVVHGSIYGVLLFASYSTGLILGELWNTQWRWSALTRNSRVQFVLIGTAAILAAELISPWGLIGSKFFSELLSDNTMVSSVGEFQRTPWIAAFIPFWIIWFSAIVVTIVALRRRDISSALVLIAFAALSWRYSRATAPFCIVAVPIVFRYVHSIVAPKLKHFSSLPAGVTIAAGAIIFTGAVIYKVAIPNHVNSFGVGLNSDFFPEATLKFLDANQIDGNMFNSGELGGYIAFAAPQRKIFLYNHHTVFSKVLDSLRAPGAAQRWKFNYALLGHNWRRYRFVFPIEQWAPVYWEPATMLLVARTAQNQAVIDAHEISYFSPEYDGDQLRSMAREASTYPRLLREISDYLAYRRDDEIALAFRDISALPHPGVDLATRERLREVARTHNPLL